jgi:malate dehydrogenase (oxaloacetate-decarboxylating)
MLLAAARTLGANSPALTDSSAPLLPSLTDLRRVAVEIAVAVGIEAQADGVAPKTDEGDLRRKVLETRWTPSYPTYVPVSHGQAKA